MRLLQKAPRWICSLLLISIVWIGVLPAMAQDDPPLSDEQRALLAQIDAADLDQRAWQSYKTVTFENIFYAENLAVAPGNTVLFQQNINFNKTTQYQGNPRNPIYNRSDLMLFNFNEVSLFSGSDPTETAYTLLVEVLYLTDRLYVRAFRSDETEFLPPMPEVRWYDVTNDPEQFPALQLVNLTRYVPTATPRPATTPLFDVDFLALIQSAALRDLIADIELVGVETLEGSGQNANRAATHIRVKLNPVEVLKLAFADNPNTDDLIEVFVNESIEMTLSVWLDPTTSQRIRERYVIVLQGAPSPLDFGYTEGDITSESSLTVQLLREIEVDYFDINVPVEIVPPDL